jgi:hypothetical protein
MELKQAYLFDVKNPSGRFMADKTLWSLLKQNPYLEYAVENEQVYVISDGADFSFVIPKGRNSPETYQLKNRSPLDKSFWAVGLGLFRLGVGRLRPVDFCPFSNCASSANLPEPACKPGRSYPSCDCDWSCGVLINWGLEPGLSFLSSFLNASSEMVG